MGWGEPCLNSSASPPLPFFSLLSMGDSQPGGQKLGLGARWVSVWQGVRVCVCVGCFSLPRGSHHTSRTEHISISLGYVCPLPSSPSQSASGASAKPQERLAASSQASRAARISGSRRHLSSAPSHSGDLSSHQLVLLSSISGGGSKAQRG